MADDEIDDNDDTEAIYPDPFVTAIELCRIAAKPATYATALKKLRRLGRDIDAAEQKLAAVQAQVEQRNAALAAREAELAVRTADIAQREDAFAASAKDAHAELARHYARIADADRRLRHHVLASADLLHGYNEQLQALPDWSAIRQMVPGLPDDRPPIEREEPRFRIDALADTFCDPNADRHGAPFLGTLTRNVSHKGAE